MYRPITIVVVLNHAYMDTKLHSRLISHCCSLQPPDEAAALVDCTFEFQNTRRAVSIGTEY
jgi:hypothetical protein